MKLREMGIGYIVALRLRKASEELLKKLLESPSVIKGLNKRGGKRYIKAEQRTKYILDE